MTTSSETAPLPVLHEPDPRRASWRALKQRAWLIVLCGVVAGGLALAYSLHQPKEYSATSVLYFNDPGFAQEVFGNSFVPANAANPAIQQATDLGLSELSSVSRATAQQLGLPAKTVLSVSVTQSSQSDLVNVTATSRSPALAARIANAYGAALIALRRQSDVSQLSQAITTVTNQLSALPAAERTSSTGNALKQRAEQLSILAALQTGNVQLAQRAFPPTTPSRPRPTRNAVAGLLVGLLLGTIGALVLQRVDRRLRTTDEIESIMDRPILGVIPQSRDLTAARWSDGGLASFAQDPFRILRTNLMYFKLGGRVRTIMLTSAEPSAGKSTIAWHLAVVAALSGESVLFVEADLRRPSLFPRVSTSLGSGGVTGLAAVLGGLASFSEAVVHLPLAEPVNGQSPRNLDVLFAGDPPPNPADLLASPAAAELLETAADNYDLVVVDTLPLAIVSDAVPLAQMVDGIIVVARLGQSTRHAVEALRRQVSNLSVNVLGVVINGASRGSGYGYGYGYTAGYEAPQDSASPSADRREVNA
jgi:capsular exopolysaccharide synthesis family protein